MLEPADTTWTGAGNAVGHRNGMVECATAEIGGTRATYRIEPIDKTDR